MFFMHGFLPSHIYTLLGLIIICFYHGYLHLYDWST